MSLNVHRADDVAGVVQPHRILRAKATQAHATAGSGGAPRRARGPAGRAARTKVLPRASCRPRASPLALLPGMVAFAAEVGEALVAAPADRRGVLVGVPGEAALRVLWCEHRPMETDELRVVRV